MQMFTSEFKQAVSTLALMMDDAAQRFDSLLKKPMVMIEKQMDQQRYMFEEAHKQKNFLERMFGELLNDQQRELHKLFDHQSRRFEDFMKMNEMMIIEMKDRLQSLESLMANSMNSIELQSQMQMKLQLEAQQKNKS